MSTPRSSKAATLPTPAPTTCQHLQLPAELRNDIYRLVLVSTTRTVNISICAARTALARTCKQIHAEAIQIFYAENDFQFTLTAESAVKLAKIRGAPKPHAELIHSMIVNIDTCGKTARLEKKYYEALLACLKNQFRQTRKTANKQMAVHTEKQRAVGRVAAKWLSSAGISAGRVNIGKVYGQDRSAGIRRQWWVEQIIRGLTRALAEQHGPKEPTKLVA